MAAFIRYVREAYPPKSPFAASDIPDLTGKVVIVTGANTGVGKETAKALLEHNATVFLACRNKDKAAAAIDDLKNVTGKEAIFLELDLGDLASVKQAAETFIQHQAQLHILYNNAGVMFPPHSMLTAQNYDLQFGTNVLGHFYFTKLLLPLMLDTAKVSAPFKPRIINTASSASYFVSTLNFNAFIPGKARNKEWGNELYNYSKLGNVIFSNELARRYGDRNIVSVSLNPGNLDSDLLRYKLFLRPIARLLLFYPSSMGALTQLWAGTTDEGNHMNGRYLIPWARYSEPNKAALDSKLGTDLWAWCEEQVEKFEQGLESPVA